MTAAGQRCTGHRGRRLSIPSHDARTTTWRDTQATSTQHNGEPK